jgi:hypothetical protein
MPFGIADSRKSPFDCRVRAYTPPGLRLTSQTRGFVCGTHRSGRAGFLGSGQRRFFPHHHGPEGRCFCVLVRQRSGVTGYDVGSAVRLFFLQCSLLNHFRNFLRKQRVDKRNVAGPPKSSAGERKVPLPPIVVNTLKEHRLTSKTREGLVFPTGTGRPEYHGNIVNRGLIPAWVAAGVVNPDGSAKYTGLHALRHFYASWCINRQADGGLELPAKTVQERLGHSTIAMIAFSARDGGKSALGVDATPTRHIYLYMNDFNMLSHFLMVS